MALRLPKPLQKLQGLPLRDPHGLWQQAHLSRRAGVLLLLSPSPTDPRDLDVLLTVRSKQLSYAGDAALPGGKADDVNESPWQVAVREAQEEVDVKASQFDFVKTLPAYVSSRMLLVVPSVAWAPHTISSLVPSVDEVDKVFSAPLRRFLHADRTTSAPTPTGPIQLHHFDLPATNHQAGGPEIDRVWGLTANILIDCARLCFDEQPDFDFYRGNKKFAGPGTSIGNMDVLDALWERGTLQKEVRR